MKKWFIILLCIYSVVGYCQVYESSRLQQMGSALRLAEICDSTFADTCLFLTYQKCQVRVNIDSDHVITHIGCAIFPDSLSLYPKQIETFIERYMLELVLPSSHEIPNVQKMQDDGVWFSEGTFGDIIGQNFLDSTVSTSLTESDKGYCFAVISNEVVKARFMFPKDVQLIRGKDKIELDHELFAQHLRNEKPALVIDTTRLKSIPLAPFMMAQGTCYLSDQLTNTIYLHKNQNLRILSSPYVFPKQTLQNIMIAGSDSTIVVRMEHHRYGYNVIADTISLNAWQNIAYNDGCIPYWGVENFNTETINGSYIWVNESLGYIHVLFVEFPIKTLLGKKDVVRCSLHSYVRMSNVTDLFYDTKHTLY
ncbi:MAG: hypothetical protein IJT12_01015 [Paludibacteraceae bacterium]|nr:hypothetical protein [Paludibacteraceae bacterium]